MVQILINLWMCVEGYCLICQDIGIVIVFLEIGMDVCWDDVIMGVEDMVNEGVCCVYMYLDNKLCVLVLVDLVGKWINIRDNILGVVNVKVVLGNKVDVIVVVKGGGLEVKIKFVMFNLFDFIVDWVLKIVLIMGVGWCLLGMFGIGIGGIVEKVMLLVKEVLMELIDIIELQVCGVFNCIEELCLELYEKVNVLGIGVQGLGGLIIVLDIKINDYLIYVVNLLVVMILNCVVICYVYFILDGSGLVMLDLLLLEDWLKLIYDVFKGICVDLDMIILEDVVSWKLGQILLFNGKLLIGCDVVYKCMVDMFNKGEELLVDLKGCFIYYVGLVDLVCDEVVGLVGLIMVICMDKFIEQVLVQIGLLGMVGKVECGLVVIEVIRKYKLVYLMVVGGLVYLVFKVIKVVKVVGFVDLGMEVIYEFIVQDMFVIVVVDFIGELVYKIGLCEWQVCIGKILVVVE